MKEVGGQIGGGLTCVCRHGHEENTHKSPVSSQKSIKIKLKGSDYLKTVVYIVYEQCLVPCFKLVLTSIDHFRSIDQGG